jgi:hypothetical protein
MKRFLSGQLTLFALIIFSIAANAAPSAELWQRWTEHDPDATQSIDHGGWDQLLDRYLIKKKNNINRFAYKAVSEDDHYKLKAYITSLGNTKISNYNRDEQLAFWINLYNALTIEVILQRYPVYSIRDISSGIFTSGPWKKKLVTVESKRLTLDDIEHRILRPIWQDPRLHYAVNCAAIGCPNLQPQAFTASNTEIMLEKAALEFVNHPRAAMVSSSGKLRVSSIYNWFEEDFGGKKGVLAHLRQYAKPKLSDALQDVDEIYGDHYNWELNGLTPVGIGSGSRVFGS